MKQRIVFIIAAVLVTLLIVGFVAVMLMKHEGLDNFRLVPNPVLVVSLPPLTCSYPTQVGREIVSQSMDKYPDLAVMEDTRTTGACQVIAHLYPYGMAYLMFDVSQAFIPGVGTNPIDRIMELRYAMAYRPTLIADYPNTTVYQHCPISWQTTHERTLQKVQEFMWKIGGTINTRFGSHSDCKLKYIYYPMGMLGKGITSPFGVQSAADVFMWVLHNTPSHL